MAKRTRRYKRYGKRYRRRRSTHKGGQQALPSFHILIVTAGRPSLRDMLDSLKPELEPADAVTIVFDGPDARSASGYTPSWLEGFKAQVTAIDDAKVGFWGAPA